MTRPGNCGPISLLSLCAFLRPFDDCARLLCRYFLVLVFVPLLDSPFYFSQPPSPRRHQPISISPTPTSAVLTPPLSADFHRTNSDRPRLATIERYLPSLAQHTDITVSPTPTSAVLTPPLSADFHRTNSDRPRLAIIERYLPSLAQHADITDITPTSSLLPFLTSPLRVLVHSGRGLLSSIQLSNSLSLDPAIYNSKGTIYLCDTFHLCLSNLYNMYISFKLDG